MSEIHILPFEPTAEAAAEWLTSIDRFPLTEKVKMLKGILNELAVAPIEKTTLLAILDHLTETILMLSKLLEHGAKRPDYSAEKSRKWRTAAFQLPKKLSFAFAELALEETLSKTQRVHCAYRALQILSLLCKRAALFYEAPDLALWKKFAELYLWADSQHWLALSIEAPVPGLTSQPTLEGLVKHALLFHACHPHYYAESDITAIFEATAKLTSGVRLDRETSDFAICYWSPGTLLPPNRVNPQMTEEPVFSIDCRDLIDYVEHYPEKNERIKAIPGVLDRLTAYHDIRRSVDPSNPKRSGLIIGSMQAAKFLNILISRYRVMELSEAHLSKSSISKLELVPLEARNTMASLSSKILADIKNLSASQLTVFETNERAFCIAKIANMDCSVDEPAILIQEEKPPCFAVIRHLRIDSNTRFRNLLIEKIDGEVYPLDIGGMQAFIIRRNDSEQTELFMPPNTRFSTHTVLNNAKGIVNDPLKIEKMLEFNAHFVRYRVSFC